MTRRSALSERAHGALADEKLRASVRNATGIMVDGRVRALAGLENADELRDAARDIRAGVMDRLPEILDQWSTRVEAAGGHVHWAADADEAVAVVLDLVRRKDARIIAITGYGQEEDREQSRAAGFDAHFVKPVDLDEIVRAVESAVPREAGLRQRNGA